MGQKRLNRLRKRFHANGPGITVAVIALILALSGAAFAASGALTAKQRKEVSKIAKAEAKKFPGPAGPVGAQGLAGTQGPGGPAGARGDKGEKGDMGLSGATGESVEVTPIAPNEPECEGRGGTLVEKEDATTASEKAEVCTGKKGADGAEGKPWTPNNVLPPGASETGTWTFSGTTSDTAGIQVALPFFIPLSAPLEGHVHYSGEGSFSTSCKGNTEFPKPEPGELCVYTNTAEEPENTTFEGIFSSSFPEEGASPEGAVLKFSAPTGETRTSGTYAVRAPQAP
jgi:hypothetical protein